MTTMAFAASAFCPAVQRGASGAAAAATTGRPATVGWPRSVAPPSGAPRRRRVSPSRQPPLSAQLSEPSPTAPPPTPAEAYSPAGTVSPIWELDFYSRPVYGSDGKKRWELLITDKNGVWSHVEVFANADVNSANLRTRVASVIADAEEKPSTIRFFRAAMFNMISIALSGLDVVAAPSRRTYALFDMIADRQANVYPSLEGYRAPSGGEGLPGFLRAGAGVMDVSTTTPMPDALRGESFAFVQLPLSTALGFFEADATGEFFGDACRVDPAMADADPLLTGLCVYSKRAKGVAAWMSGAEVVAVKADVGTKEVVLLCGLSTSYLFARLVGAIREEGKAFERAKEASGGVHFLAVMVDEGSDEVEGFWLLREPRGMDSL